MQQFLQGLPWSVGQKVLEDTAVETYEQMKKKAISITPSISSMLYTSDPKGAFLKDPTSEKHGRQRDSTSKATKIHSHKDKALGRPPST